MTRKRTREKAAPGAATPKIPDPRRILAEDNGPLLLAVAVNRVTGKVSMANSPLPEQDVPLALQAVRLLQDELQEAVVRAAEKRGAEKAAKAEEA